MGTLPLQQADRWTDRGGLFAGLGSIFDRHIFEFAGFEDFAALEALDVFRVFFAADDLHARMLTLIHSNSQRGSWRPRLVS